MQLAFGDSGLLPVVVQDVATGAVLMVAFANEEAVRLTRATNDAHFWSRSRKALWKKGETSGNTMRVVEVRVDCDADTLLYVVDPRGAACHTGSRSCFYRQLDDERADEGPPGNVLDRLAKVIEDRIASSTGAKSYVRSLADGGWPKILAKIAEEHGELAAAFPNDPVDHVVHEAADLLFHMLVGLGERGISPARVLGELAKRFGTSGHDEKAARNA